MNDALLRQYLLRAAIPLHSRHSFSKNARDSNTLNGRPVLILTLNVK